MQITKAHCTTCSPTYTCIIKLEFNMLATERSVQDDSYYDRLCTVKVFRQIVLIVAVGGTATV